MPKIENRRQLIFDLNPDGSIVGARWQVLSHFEDEDGSIIPLPDSFPEAKPEEWPTWLGAGLAVTAMDAKDAHQKIAGMQALVREKDALLTAKDNLINALLQLQATARSAENGRASATQNAIETYNEALRKAPEARNG